MRERRAERADTRRNQYRVTHGDIEGFIPKGHPATTCGDVINLLSQAMSVEQGARAGQCGGFCQALIAAAMG